MALDFPGSPATGTTYTGPGGVIWVWDSAKWVSGTLTTGIYAPITNDAGRNLLHNSMFNVAQRGAGGWTVNGYTMDRWLLALSLDTVNISQLAATDAVRAGIGDEAVRAVLNALFTGNAGAASYTIVTQRIEDVRRLAGKTITVSFYATASVALKLGVSIDQSFGAGGSPSADVPLTGQSVTLTTTWARYSVTFTLPSVAGKTLGTNGGDYTQVLFWFSAGATSNVRAGSIGVQAGNIYIWGVQLEIGTVATPLQKLDPITELQQCQRFYQVGNFKSDTYSAAGSASGVYQSFPVQMRATPLVTPTFNIQTNGGSGNTSAVSIYGFEVYTIATAAGYVTISGPFTAAADL